MDRNIQHVYPINDTIEHLLETEVNPLDMVFKGGIWPALICKCPCNPEIKYLADGDGAVIVVHDAMDGRLGVEWANEILDKDK